MKGFFIIGLTAIIVSIFVIPLIGSRLYLATVSEVGYIGIMMTFEEGNSRDTMLNNLGWFSSLVRPFDIEDLGRIDGNLILEFATREERNQVFLRSLSMLRTAQAEGTIRFFGIHEGVSWGGKDIQNIPAFSEDAYPTKFTIRLPDEGIEAEKIKAFLERSKLLAYLIENDLSKLLRGGDTSVYWTGKLRQVYEREICYHNFMKKVFTAEQKASVALAALKEQQSINQISAAYEVHPTQIGLWRKQAMQGLKDVFSDKRKKAHRTQEQLIAQLYQTIGQRDMELAWLKKKIEPFVSSG